MIDSANTTNPPLLDFFQGAMLYSAVGDALGWPTEYGYTYKNRGLKPFYEVPLAGFVEWRQLYAGWSGYEEPVRAGEYSDDTQLTLAIARCISVTGDKVIHPVLGDGTIIERVERAIPEKDFDVKLVRVQFTCGQSCLFRSKVEKDGRLSESLLGGSDRVY